MRSKVLMRSLPARAVGAALCAMAGGMAMEGAAWAESGRVTEGVLFRPPSNEVGAAPAERHARTFLRVVRPSMKGVQAGFKGGPPGLGYQVETPASLLCIYRFTANVSGCNPNVVTNEGTGGSDVIAIVDAFDYVDAQSDLTAYSTQFGLPAPTSKYFEKVYATGTAPASSSGTGWDIEAALDIEMAHSLAPTAKVVLVEAASSSFTDMFYAVTVAGGIVQAAGGGEVSMSWGGSESSGETAWDSDLSGTTNVTYYAASGDSAGTIYPCASPNVVCVGGLSISRNPSTLAFLYELAWVDTGGGVSPYEPALPYQTTAMRGMPDVSALADPNYDGVWVYNCTYEAACYWYQVGGTSAATPITASLDNRKGLFYASSADYLSALYAGNLGDATNVNPRTDIFTSYCGVNYSLLAGKGWDQCTGWGAPKDD
jgi:hypothetical protein